MVDTVKGFVYKIDMTKKSDGRKLRGAVRRQAWTDLAAVADEEAPKPNATLDPLLGVGGDESLKDLYQSTRKEILRWMNARGRGVMGGPPGGVGSR